MSLAAKAPVERHVKVDGNKHAAALAMIKLPRESMANRFTFALLATGDQWLHRNSRHGCGAKMFL